MNKRESQIAESMDELALLIRKGASTVYYYMDLGVPKFDVMLSDNGSKINKQGKRISCGKASPEELNSRLCSLMDEAKAMSSSQAELF